jgi:adenylate cyclase
MTFSSPFRKSGNATDSSGSAANVQYKVRDCANHIIASCELLKLEIESEAGTDLTQHLEKLRSEIVILLRDVEEASTLSSQSAADASTAERRLLLGTKGIHARIKEIQRVVKAQPQLDLTEDLLELEFTVHQFLQLTGQLIATLAAAARSVGGARPNSPPPPGSPEISQPPVRKVVLIADDDEANRDLLARLLRRDRYELVVAANGQEVLHLIDVRPIDLILLDLVMPGMSGFEVLRAAKANLQLKDIPIIMISGVDETEKVVACIETGADDYVLKPFNATLLRTRVRALLDRKHARDQERAQTEQLKAALSQLEAERQTTEKLLLNILPRKACEELRLRGSVSPTYFEDVSIVFTDFVSFTSSAEKLTADELVTLLNEYFTAFDNIVDRYRLEKLKTVGDSYIFLSGLPERTPSHPIDALLASIEMLQFVKAAQQARPHPGWSMRIGVHTGSVIAGVVGKSKFAFDVWGDAINFASRMVSSGASNKINVSERTYQRSKDFFSCTPRGSVGIKGNRQAEMYFVDDVLPSLLEPIPSGCPAPFSERYRRYFQRELLAFPAGLQVPSPLDESPLHLDLIRHETNLKATSQ